MAKFALQSRVFWLFVLVGHAFGAAAWFGLLFRPIRRGNRCTSKPTCSPAGVSATCCR